MMVLPTDTLRCTKGILHYLSVRNFSRSSRARRAAPLRCLCSGVVGARGVRARVSMGVAVRRQPYSIATAVEQMSSAQRRMCTARSCDSQNSHGTDGLAAMHRLDSPAHPKQSIRLRTRTTCTLASLFLSGVVIGEDLDDFLVVEHTISILVCQFEHHLCLLLR